MLRDELNLRIPLSIEGDPEDLEPIRVEADIEGSELGRAIATATAPGRPEIQDDPMAAVRGEVDRPPIQGLELEFRRGASDGEWWQGFFVLAGFERHDLPTLGDSKHPEESSSDLRGHREW